MYPCFLWLPFHAAEISVNILGCMLHIGQFDCTYQVLIILLIVQIPGVFEFVSQFLLFLA